jgi:sec-independent protein translocase protein TatC
MKGKPEPAEAEQGMTLWEHLDELRSRLVKMILAFVAGCIIAWTKKEYLLDLISRPFIRAWRDVGLKGEPWLAYLSPAAQFLAYIRIAAIAGALLSLPFLLWQVWAFIAPGLYSKEKRYAVPFVVSSCLLFAGGGYFGWRFTFPLAFRFLLGIGQHQGAIEVRPNITMSDYLEFVSRMLLAFGIAAELPVLIFFLSIAGLITWRHLVKFFRYFLVLDFIVAAVITPPDMMSQLLLALPLAGLYIISIGVAWLVGRKPAPPEAPAA